MPLWDIAHGDPCAVTEPRKETVPAAEGVPLWQIGEQNPGSATPESRKPEADAAGAVPLWEMGPPARATRAYREEEGTPAQWLAVAGCCGIAGLLGWLFHRFFFRGYGMEALDLAQLSRNLSRGQGFSTDFLRPVLLSHISGGKLVPDLSNAPLYPLLLGSLFAFLGESDRAVPMLPILLLAASASLLFVLARRLSHSVWVSCLAVGAYLLAQPVLSAVDAAQPMILSTCLLLWLLLAMTPFRGETNGETGEERPGESSRSGSPAIAAKRHHRRHFWIGALVGLCYLADYFSLLYVVPLLILWRREAAGTPVAHSPVAHLPVAHRTARGRAALPTAWPMMLGAALVVAPWLWRNFVLTGNPVYSTQWLELAMNTRQTPGMSLLRDAGGSAAVWPGPGALGIKWVHDLAGLCVALPRLPHISLTPFVVGAFFLGFESERLNRVKWAISAAFASYLLGLSLLGRGAAALLPLVPGFCLLGAAAYQHLVAVWLRRLRERAGSTPELLSKPTGAQKLRRLAPALSVLVPLALFAVPLAGHMAQAGAPGPGEAVVRAYFEPLGAAIKADDKRAIASDVPWAVAWYAARRAVWLPNTRAQLALVEAKQPLSAVYLSPSVGSSASELTGAQEWQGIYQGAEPLDGFDRNPRAAQRDVLLVKRPTLDQISRIARAQPENPDLQLRLGQTQLLSGRLREALATFEHVEAMAPHAPHGYWGAGKALYGLKSYDKSLAAFNEAIARAGSVPPLRLEAQLQSADILNSRRDFKGAASLYETVLADQPENLVALNNLAFIYAADGQNLNRALDMARRAAAANPKSGLIRDTLGWVCFRLGRYSEAAAQLREAARLEPKSAVVQGHLKQALAATSQK